MASSTALDPREIPLVPQAAGRSGASEFSGNGAVASIVSSEPLPQGTSSSAGRLPTERMKRLLFTLAPITA